LRILQLSSAQAFGGGERHLADLANGMTRRGHEVFAALRPGSSLASELNSLPSTNIVTMRLRNAIDAVSARKLARFVKDNKIEILHAHLARDYPLAAYAVRANHSCKLVLTRHVLFPLNRLHSLTLSRPARVIAVSGAVKRALAAQQLMPEDRIIVIHNGIDTARFGRTSKADQLAFRRQWKIPDDAVVVGTVGELTALKGHGDFLDSAGSILRSFPDTHFLIAGLDASPGMPNLAALKKQINKLRLDESVRLIGWVEDLPCLYQSLDIFVSASHSESFGLAIAEAMSSSTAVVSTSTEGAAEIIENGVSGKLVGIGDVDALAIAVGELIEDESQRARLKTEGQKRIESEFSLEKMMSATERLYREVLMA